MSQIFILAGKSRTGKDTVGSYIKEYYEKQGKVAVMLSFSEYLKPYIMKLTNWNGEDKTKPRDFMQLLGTDIIRKKINNNFFIDRLCEDILIYSYFADAIIITGARFPDEINIPRKTFKNVHVIEVTRNKENDLTEKEKKHVTETSLDNFKDYDYIIENNGSLEELKTKTNKIMEELE